MADARPLLRIRGGIKAQSVWLCRGGRAPGGGQGTHSGDRVAITQGRSGSHSRSIATCSAVFINPLLLLCGPICGGSTTRGGDQAHAHMVHSPRAVPCSSTRCVGVPPACCAHPTPCPACCAIRVRELRFRNPAKGPSRCHAAARPVVSHRPTSRSTAAAFWGAGE